MKILILANNDGGLYLFRKELIVALAEENEVYASVPDEDGCIDKLEALGCNCIITEIDRRGMNPLKDFSLLRKYNKMISKEHPDLVITYTIKPNIYGGLVSRARKISYAANITGLGTAFQGSGVLRKVVTAMYRTSLRRAKVVYFENSANRDLFLKERIVKSDQACLLNGAGVNLNHFSFKDYPDNEIFHFLFIGRVMKEKGIDELLEAMRKLNENGEECILDVVGPCEENYREQLQKCEEQGWLKYFGSQDDVRPFIEMCDCFVLPSYHEGMANTNLECAASGRPLITSNIPGCKEAVIAGVSGYLCEPKNVEDLYKTMVKMLRNNRESRMKMGESARKHMEKKFDKKTVVNRTIARLLS